MTKVLRPLQAIAMEGSGSSQRYCIVTLYLICLLALVVYSSLFTNYMSLKIPMDAGDLQWFILFKSHWLVVIYYWEYVYNNNNNTEDL